MEAAASSPAHFRVTLSGGPFEVPGAFAQMSGGNPSGDVRRYKEGGDPNDHTSGNPPTRDDVTIGRPWRRTRDHDLALAFDRAVMKSRFTITKQPLDEDFNAWGKPMVYADCLLTGCNHPDVDAEATGDVARLELTFAVAGELA